jgi:hypothetical protein
MTCARKRYREQPLTPCPPAFGRLVTSAALLARRDDQMTGKRGFDELEGRHEPQDDDQRQRPTCHQGSHPAAPEYPPCLQTCTRVRRLARHHAGALSSRKGSCRASSIYKTEFILSPHARKKVGGEEIIHLAEYAPEYEIAMRMTAMSYSTHLTGKVIQERRMRSGA